MLRSLLQGSRFLTRASKTCYAIGATRSMTSRAAHLLDVSEAPGIDPNTFPFDVYPDFITEEQHDRLLAFFHKTLRRFPYEYDHLDRVIRGFREVSRTFSLLPTDIQDLCNRMFEYFPEESNIQPALHVLDLEEGGEIDCHVDSVKFCGSHIAGVCLGSSANMVLKDEHSDAVVRVHLPCRGFYVMHDEARWNYAHGVTKELEGGVRGRRISLLVRNEAEEARHPKEYDFKVDPEILAEFEAARAELCKNQDKKHGDQ